MNFFFPFCSFLLLRLASCFLGIGVCAGCMHVDKQLDCVQEVF